MVGYIITHEHEATPFLGYKNEHGSIVRVAYTRAAHSNIYILDMNFNEW